MVSKQRQRKFISILLVAVAGISSANAEIVAKVTDLGLPGKATIVANDAISQPREIDFLDKLELGQSVSIDDAGELTIVYFESGVEYRYAGPAKFIVGAGKPEDIEGKPQRVKDYKLLEKTGLKLTADQKHRDQAALVFRAMDPYPNKVKALRPNKTKILSTSPSFSWAEISEDAEYEFVLTDSTGKIEFQSTLKQNQLDLPAQVSLEADRKYNWRVRSIHADTEYVGSANFELGSETITAKLTRSRPNITTSFSEQVVYAMLLEQEGFDHDARKQWQRMAKAKPNNAAIKSKLEEFTK